jgi:hypothetical protein
MITQISQLLTPTVAAYVQARFLDPGVHWYFQPVSANASELGDPWAHALSHLIYKDGEAVSPLYDPALLVLLALADRQGFTLDQCLRMRLGMLTRVPHPVVHAPHVDHTNPKHRTACWYANDSSGPTVIYNETRESTAYTELHREPPIFNNCVDFDGRHFHSSSAPDQHMNRVVLTINYTIK